MKKGTLLFGQSGGPSAVINASAYGVIKEALKHQNEIEDVLVMRHGIEGALNEDFIKVSEYIDQLELLPKTPGSAFGSVRHKLSDYNVDDREFVQLLDIFKKYNVRYFLYNGGNDSMDTCLKISEYVSLMGYEMSVLGVPKTIDNDLPHTDHTPGFGSAAKFIINTVMQLQLDSVVYPKGKVTIVEIMGRHAGWLAASSHVASLSGMGPDLVYLPENTFDQEEFFKRVAAIYKEKHQCFICVSEGIKDNEGNFIGSLNQFKDAFGHLQLGGVANYLGDILENKLGLSYRAIELSTIQRSAAYIRSKTDVKEAIKVGKKTVEAALKGETGKMVVMNRANTTEYKIEYSLHDLKDIANMEKVIPDSMIKNDTEMTQEFFDYMMPLIEGESKQEYRNGMQLFFKL